MPIMPRALLLLQQLNNDLASEMTAAANYNAAIKTAREIADNATGELLEEILKDEDSHIDLIEEKLEQIQQMAIQNFLSVQTEV